ncbi:MAG: hypothetical protein ACHQWU_05480 [Gemmatimonadales bacterium]
METNLPCFLDGAEQRGGQRLDDDEIGNDKTRAWNESANSAYPPGECFRELRCAERNAKGRVVLPQLDLGVYMDVAIGDGGGFDDVAAQGFAFPDPSGGASVNAKGAGLLCSGGHSRSSQVTVNSRSRSERRCYIPLYACGDISTSVYFTP